MRHVKRALYHRHTTRSRWFLLLPVLLNLAGPGCDGFVLPSQQQCNYHYPCDCPSLSRRRGAGSIWLQNQQSPAPRHVAINRPTDSDTNASEDDDKSRHKNNNNSKDNGQPVASRVVPLMNHSQWLWSFVHNLQRERREKRIPNKSNDNNNHNQNRPHPAKSLVTFLTHHQYLPPPSSPQQQQTTAASGIIEALSRAVVQAIRLASELGDYKLIQHLVDASIHYANGRPILIPRLFGEAIDGMSKTSANVAKIKHLWNLGTTDAAAAGCLTRPLGTFELNIMIKALASRGKIRPALDLYQHHALQPVQQQNEQRLEDAFPVPAAYTEKYASVIPVTTIVPDAYTLSSLFSALEESITNDQAIKDEQVEEGPEQEGDILVGDSTFRESSCWQWKEAMSLLETYGRQSTWPRLNNHVFASLLKLNERASQVYSSSDHNGAQIALKVLFTMQQMNISPDVVTCSLILANFRYQWKTAVNLLYAMKTTNLSDDNTWKLPRPNVYTYSSVITICAHCRQYQVAVDLLEEMKLDSTMESPNTWVYNAALLATTRSSDSVGILTAAGAHRRSSQTQKRNQERLHMALKLLREMKGDAEDGPSKIGDNSACAPDTVTYNTVLAALAGAAGQISQEVEDGDEGGALEKQRSLGSPTKPAMDSQNISVEERVVHSLLDEMVLRNIMRDSITYRNAILAVRALEQVKESVWRLLDRAFADVMDKSNDNGGPDFRKSSRRQLDGKAAEGTSFIFETALIVLASRGEVDGVLRTFTKMMGHARTDSGAPQRHTSPIHLINALGSTENGNSALIPLVLDTIKGSHIAKLGISKRYPSLDDRIFQGRELDGSLFAAAISSSLVANDMDSARKVLRAMKKEGRQPSEESWQEIARTYARLAIDFSVEKATKVETEIMENANESGRYRSIANLRARSAYVIACKSLKDPSPGLLSTIARTCATVGMWKEARTILKRIHERVKTGASFDSSRMVLPGLHKALLRATSIHGNVTAALWYVDDIQALAMRLGSTPKGGSSDDDAMLAVSGDYKEAYMMATSPLLSSGSGIDSLSMTADDWKLLLIAAAKSGHWRVCLSTLQFLRPYLEETHPSSLGITVEERNRRYERLAPSLTVATKCLEMRSQYGWAVRAIEDWIEWSGRRPPKSAVLSAVRILSHRGRGTEVNALLTRCTQNELAIPPFATLDNYDTALYVGAITALHHEGHYDEADDAFVAAVSGGSLPLALQREEDDGQQRLVLDLHGMNVPVAHAAVRVAIQQEIGGASRKTRQTGISSTPDFCPWENDLVIVTGRGRNSALRMRPVLRPEIQRMLSEEFYPPLNTISVPGNMGALRVTAADICAWLAHQREQKGFRMLAVAAVLKNVSSMDRLRKSIALRANTGRDGNQIGTNEGK